MRYQQDLQVALRERLRRIMTEHDSTAAHQIRQVVDWIDGQPALRAILVEAEQVEPDLDFDAFDASFDRRFSWPSHTEAGKVSLVWKLLQKFADVDRTRAEDRIALDYAMGIALGNGTLNDQWREFCERIIAPLFDFLTERVGAESSVLYVLERYVRRVEWFDRERLHVAFSADRRNGEEVYNLDLQRFLFLEGNYVTHAKPRSASGEADLIGDIDADDALVCDGKIFDGDGRGRSYLAKGFNQIVNYAQDYQKGVAYLVVFNLSGRPLQLSTDGRPDQWPQYVEMSGIRVYLVSIRALPPQATASKLGKATPWMITRDHLVNPDIDA